MPNALHPNRMSPAERIAEVAEILAAGFMRLSARQSSGVCRKRRESLVDFSPLTSGVRRCKLRDRKRG